jgi:hypothetical protein
MSIELQIIRKKFTDIKNKSKDKTLLNRTLIMSILGHYFPSTRQAIFGVSQENLTGEYRFCIVSFLPFIRGGIGTNPQQILTIRIQQFQGTIQKAVTRAVSQKKIKLKQCRQKKINLINNKSKMSKIDETSSPDGVSKLEEYWRHGEANGEKEQSCSHSTPEGVQAEISAGQGVRTYSK